MAAKTSSRAKRTSESLKAALPAADAPATDAEPAAPLRKPDFIDRVVERSGGKKKDVKPAVEAALAVLGEALAQQEELNLPPLGKLKVTRHKQAPNADVLICRLRRPHHMTGTTDSEK